MIVRTFRKILDFLFPHLREWIFFSVFLDRKLVVGLSMTNAAGRRYTRESRRVDNAEG